MRELYARLLAAFMVLFTAGLALGMAIGLN
jgi:hypothetical protein